jgi:holo-[acyl-carrier protein] synthase
MRVGIDLVSVETVAESIRDHGDSYLRRIYTEAELRDCAAAGGGGAEGVVPERLAARFAAKEAAIKVLRPTEQDTIPWRDIEVVRYPSGWVQLQLSAAAASLAAERGLRDFELSISHEAGFAAAVVVAN